MGSLNSKLLFLFNNPLSEMKQIEEWTQMKIGNIIFDSDVDNWKVNETEFDERILNKSNLIFLIEDDVGNLFGGYINVKIDKTDYWISDPNAFVFSLKSNGRLNGMMKFDIKKEQYAFCLFKKFENWLFEIGIGDDINIFKENYKTQSRCHNYSFNYNKIENSLCGKREFIPTRLTVIQMFA